MNKFKVSLAAVVLLSAFLLGACATVPPGSAIIQQQANSLVPPEGWGAIYVFRPGFPPGDNPWRVNLDSKLFGQVTPKSYLYGLVKPGEHSVDLAYAGSRIRFEARQGENYFFKISLASFPGASLTVIDAEEARHLLADSTLSGLNMFENDETRQILRNNQEKK